MKLMFVVIAAAGLAALQVPAGSGGAARSVWSGVYTVGQAKLGQASYEKECASCHGGQLDGGNVTPALSGDDFMSDWAGQTVGDLFDRIRTTMPAGHPGTLSPEEDVNIVAFILQFNKFPAGNARLPAESDKLKQIILDVKKPN